MKKKSSLKHTGAFWAFCAPCCILFGVFFLVPLVLSIAFSFTNYDGWKTIDFVGLTNYITLFKVLSVPGADAAVHGLHAAVPRHHPAAGGGTALL